MVAPGSMRRQLIALVNNEIRNAAMGRKAAITLKLNSLSDPPLIQKLYEAAAAGVDIRMVVRGIFCAKTEIRKFKKPMQALSIVDEYLEHSRIMIFHNNGKEHMYISSADWMVRNLDHRIEAACPVIEPALQKELHDFVNIQLSDNVKARLLTNDLSNEYNHIKGKPVRSQHEIYNYLLSKSKRSTELKNK
jgi:polyphosphate kinase